VSETVQSEIVTPFPFLPDLKPGKMGPYFEMRYYALRAGTLPDLMKRWESKIEARLEMCPSCWRGRSSPARRTGSSTHAAGVVRAGAV